jgi:hypothetical protein
MRRRRPEFGRRQRLAYAERSIGEPADADHPATTFRMPADGGLGRHALGEKTGWSGSLRWRYLASSPLTEDNAFRSSATRAFNGCVGYRADFQEK